MMRRHWTAMDDDVLRALHANGHGVSYIAVFMICAKCTIHRRARALGLDFGGRRPWTAEELRILRKRYPDELAVDVARALGRPVGQVHQAAARYGLRKSDAFKASDLSARIRRGKQSPAMVAHQFQKWLVPHNKGLRRPGWAPGRMRETQFKKGHLSGRAAKIVQPIGAQRISKDGYLECKVNNDMPLQARWKAVHRLVWEQAHGRIPPKHIVAFKTGCRTAVAAEITVDKLELISMADNMRRNTYHRYPQPIPQLIQLRGALNRKINRRSKP